MKKESVLIVEDNAVVAETLRKQLKELGYENIVIAECCVDAIKYVDEVDHPTIIFMDIFLKGEKNGIDTAFEIYRRAQIPIIFTSAPENLYLVEDAKLIKSSTFLSKPFDIDSLRNSIEEINEEELKNTPEYKEANRLRAVNKYEIIDTPREGNFDRITRMAATLLKVPVALVSVVDHDRIWFKSRYGFRDKEIPKSSELFGSSFLSDHVYQSHNGKDEKALNNPVFAYARGYHFFASAPLLTEDGYNLGMLCIMDKEPRYLSEHEQKILHELAAIIMDEMEMRLSARRAYRLQREFLSMAVHDLKNPLNGIIGFSELISGAKTKEEIEEYNGFLKQSAQKMLEIVGGLLETSLIEIGQIRIRKIPVHFSEILNSVIEGNKSQAHLKQQELIVNIQTEAVVNADPVRLGEVLDNLVSNAIKYSPHKAPIYIDVKEHSGRLHMSVKDQGPGLSREEIGKVFDKFSRLSPQPTGGENSTGLGLSIAKQLIELHDGEITAQSDGVGKGSIFSIELPVADEENTRKASYGGEPYDLRN